MTYSIHKWYNNVMTRKKVYVAVLNQGTTIAGMETNLTMWMSSMSDRYDFKVHFPVARPIPNNRNRLVNEVLAGDYDYLFMIDDDNPPFKNPFELLDFDKPVIAGVYPGRDWRGIHFHVYRLDDSQEEPVFFQYPPEFREGLKRVDAVGTGLFVVRRDVLEKMREARMAPFEDLFREDGTLITNDDMAFCLKCRELDIPVFAHFDYTGSHMKEVDLMWIANLVAYAARTGKTSFPDKKDEQNNV